MRKAIIGFVCGVILTVSIGAGYNFYNWVLLRNQVYTNCEVVAFSIRQWLLENHLVREEKEVFVVSDLPGDYPSFAQSHHFARRDAAGYPVDEWGHEYRYRILLKGGLLYISVCSCSSDGIFDTPDDVFCAFSNSASMENVHHIKSFGELEQFLLTEGCQDISELIKSK